MLHADGLHVHDPPLVIPWEGEASEYARVLGTDPEEKARAHTIELLSTEHSLNDVTLIPGVTGILRVRLIRVGSGWGVMEAVLYMGAPQAPAIKAAGEALAQVLGPAEHVPASDDISNGHSELRRWRTGPVVTSHGWFLEYTSRVDWDEHEIRIQREDRPPPWR